MSALETSGIEIVKMLHFCISRNELIISLISSRVYAEDRFNLQITTINSIQRDYAYKLNITNCGVVTSFDWPAGAGMSFKSN